MERYALNPFRRKTVKPKIQTDFMLLSYHKKERKQAQTINLNTQVTKHNVLNSGDI